MAGGGGNASVQNALLEALTDGLCLTIDELVDATSLNRGQMIKSLCAMVSHGLIERVDRGCFQLTADGVQAKQDGRKLRSGPKGRHTGRRRAVVNTLRQRLWTAARTKGLHGKWTIDDLLELAASGTEKSPKSNATHYVAMLERSGYVRRLRSRQQGFAQTSPGAVRWQLALDTGPGAPRLVSKGTAVYDPNTCEVKPLEPAEVGHVD